MQLLEVLTKVSAIFRNVLFDLAAMHRYLKHEAFSCFKKYLAIVFEQTFPGYRI